jgi:hypothetical protein
MRIPRFSSRGRFRRLASTGIAALSAVLLISVLAAPPASADSTASLPGAGGHTCLGSTGDDDIAYQAVFCADLALYTNSKGQQYVTLQAEAYCQYYDGEPQTCKLAGVAGTVANGSGYTDWTVQNCDGDCETYARNYMFPFGGLPISPGACDANVWGVIEVGSGIILPDGTTITLSGSNLETPHYEVCEESDGTIKYK